MLSVTQQILHNVMHTKFTLCTKNVPEKCYSKRTQMLIPTPTLLATSFFSWYPDKMIQNKYIRTKCHNAEPENGTE